MTYGRDAQPDMYHGDGFLRGLHQAQSQVRCLSRQIRLEITSIRRSESPKHILASKKWIKGTWGARRCAQQAVLSYKGLIAEREMQRSVLEAG